MQEAQWVEILKSSSLDKTHQYLMVTQHILGTILKGPLAPDDVIAKQSFGEMIV